MEPMAARLAPARTRTMHKTLLNFVSEGAWSDEAVLAAMRSQVLPAMQAHGPLRFWIVDESGMPKKGKHSVGVARQYCGEVGKVDNCQVMVSLSVANEAACLPLAAQLYLPEAWAVDEERRSKAPRRRLPEQTSTRPGADPRRARRGGAARRRPGR
jgi:SRSO17 transposase